MAFLEKDPNSGIYYCGFMLGGRKFKRSLQTTSASEAETVRSRVSETIRLLKTGRITMPSDADAVTFVLSDGKLKQPIVTPKVLTVGELMRKYIDEAPETKEATTTYNDKLRAKRFMLTVGKSVPMSLVTTETLQQYVNTRAKQKTKHGKITSQVTIKNEIQSILGIVNRWALPLGLVQRRLSAAGLVYPKTRAQLPFQTFAEIEAQIARGVSPEEEKELWRSLYLTSADMTEMLEQTKKAGPPWLHVLVAIACHTGARRGEIMRAELSDLDFVSDVIRIREKKRDNTREWTMRTVPLSRYLRTELDAWLKQHPGGRYLVCSEKDKPLTIGEARHFFESALKSTRFAKLRGFHATRHGFCSAAVAKGVDQRLLDEWVGHLSDAVRKRYRHIYPQASKNALASIFD